MPSHHAHESLWLLMIAYEHLRVIMTSHKCSLVLMSFLWVNRYIGLTILKAKKNLKKKNWKNVRFEKKQALHICLSSCDYFITNKSFQTLLKQLWNIFKAQSIHYWTTGERLLKHWWNISQTLVKNWWKASETLMKHWWNTG